MNRRWNQIKCVWSFAVSMILFARKVVSGSTNWKPVIMMSGMRNVENQPKGMATRNSKHCSISIRFKLRKSLWCNWMLNIQLLQNIAKPWNGYWSIGDGWHMVGLQGRQRRNTTCKFSSGGMKECIYCIESLRTENESNLKDSGKNIICAACPFSKSSAMQNCFGKKSMLCDIRDQRGVIEHEISEPPKNVNGQRAQQYWP